MALTQQQVVMNDKESTGQLSGQRTSASQYVYTLDNNVLSEEQRAFYEQNGYIIIPKLIEDELLDQCRVRFVDICNGVVDKGASILMKDVSLRKTSARGEFLYNKIQDISWHDVFCNYLFHPNLLKYVECFTGPDITAVNSALINKPPDSGKMTSVHPLHQDLFYFPFRPAERIVAGWTAMEKITVNNGCLFVIPGTHKSSLQPHDYPENEVNYAFHGIKGFDLVSKVNLEMEKGDTVFFHPLLMHGSGPNLTTGCRKAISCHFASNNCYYIDVKGYMQENVIKEILEMFCRVGLKGVSYADVWRLRQRHIQGILGPLNKAQKE